MKDEIFDSEFFDSEFLSDEPAKMLTPDEWGNKLMQDFEAQFEKHFSPKNYQYRVVTIDSSRELERELNESTRDGWQIFQMFNASALNKVWLILEKETPVEETTK